MDERDSHCPYLLSSETTAKGTGLAESAGQEDPVELDSSLALWRHTRRVEHVGGPPGPPVKYHYSYRFLTYPVRRGGEPPAGSRFWCQAARAEVRLAGRMGWKRRTWLRWRRRKRRRWWWRRRRQGWHRVRRWQMLRREKGND